MNTSVLLFDMKNKFSGVGKYVGEKDIPVTMGKSLFYVKAPIFSLGEKIVNGLDYWWSDINDINTLLRHTHEI